MPNQRRNVGEATTGVLAAQGVMVSSARCRRSYPRAASYAHYVHVAKMRLWKRGDDAMRKRPCATDPLHNPARYLETRAVTVLMRMH